MSEVKLPEGYKQTEVGVIPEDWEVKDIGEALTIKHGKDQKQVESSSGQYPIFGTGGQMGWANNFLYNKPSVLIGRKGSINKPRYIDVPFWTVDTLFYSQVHNGYDEKFMFYKFCLIDWMNYNEASGVPSLNASTISNVKISVPKKLEQTAIATALSDVDELIQSLEKLIAKKEAIKTGTMQQLLTGKTRLPEFATREDRSTKGFKQTELGRVPEDWEVSNLPKVAWFQEGPGVRNSQFQSYGIKLLNGTNIDNGVLLLEKTSRYISEKLAYGQYSHFMIDDGDLLIACSGVSIDRFDEKVTIASDEDLPLCLNTSTMRFKVSNEKLYKLYLFYFLKSSFFKKQIGGTATGSAQLNFGPFHVNKVMILLPSLEEQTAIATILSDMDAEIQALQQRLDKTRDIKQGMMQQLLTGKVRLAY